MIQRAEENKEIKVIIFPEIIDVWHPSTKNRVQLKGIITL